jgi:acetyl-CoA synthetase
VTFGELRELSVAAASEFRAAGAGPGDRVAIVLPPGVAGAAAILGAIRAGLIAVPISGQVGADGLAHRLGDSDPALTIEHASQLRLDTRTARDPGRTPDAESPALLMYTSGSTGKPKGVLHAQRALLGQHPGLKLAYADAPAEELFWTPGDWPWVMLAVLEMWHQGRPVLAAPRRGFDADWAWDLMERHRVRLAFMTPTALRMLGQARPRPGVRLRSVTSGGEPVGEDLHAWTREKLGAVLLSMYGQTEADIIVGDAPSLHPPVPGSLGRPLPSHSLAVVDAEGRQLPAGTPGELVLAAPDDSLMLEYWRQPEATARKVRDGWMWTGDEVVADEDGLLWFRHRTDDIIKSGGYRVGPGEVEDCLLALPEVANAAAVGSPDPVRGEVVKAFVVLTAGVSASPAVEDQLREHTRSRLATYQRPRRFEFVAELPLTSTGKINRAELRRRERERAAD